MQFKYNGLIKYRKAQPLERLMVEIPFCHQSSYTRLELLKKYYFNLDYKICADYDFFLKCYRSGEQFAYIEKLLSRYEFGGLSACGESEIQAKEEETIIHFKNGLLNEKQYRSEILLIEKYKRYRRLKSRIKRLLPSVLLEKLIYRKDLKNGWSRREL